MKILVLTNYYPPAHVGGYELACQQTVNWLRQQGHQVRVLCGDWQAQILPAETDVLRRLQLIDY